MDQMSTGTCAEGRANLPLVSVIMPTYRSASTLPAAMGSVLRQTHPNIELIIADDASDDESCDIVRRVALTDPRVRLLTSPTNHGPAAARNRALRVATGDWIAIVDSDDLIHPHRFSRMLAAAKAKGAEMVADDMVPFGDTTGIGGSTMYATIGAGSPQWADATFFVRSEMSRTSASLGYCKPLISRRAVEGLHYDESIGIGEDFDFYLRALMRGVAILFWPEPTYLYRRHTASLSHRLSVHHMERQIAAHDRLAAPARKADMTDLEAVLGERREMLVRALEFERLVAAIKSGQLRAVVGHLAQRPALVANLARSLAERWQRRRSNGVASETQVQKVRLVTDQSTAPVSDGASVLRVPAVPQHGPASSHRELATRLAVLYGSGPLDVTVVGVAALYGLGYLPGARRITVELLPGEELPDSAFLPAIDQIHQG